MNKQETASYRKAGEIAQKVVAYAKSIIKPGMPLLEIAEKIEGKTIALGGKPAFPVNLSLNEIAAHYTPSPDDETKAEGLLNVDIGIAVDGCIADTAFSVDLTKDEEYKEMIGLNEMALEEALKIIKPGMQIREIGEAIVSVVGDKYSIIRNLSGHSLGKNLIHAGLTIPNYKNNNENKLNDIAIAIEPFLTSGQGEVYEGKDSEIYMLQKEGAVRDKDSREILKFIKEKYRGRPFCRRWLVKEGFGKVNFALKILTQQKILKNFPLLIEKSRKAVSQAEHSVLISDKAEVYTRD